MTDYDPTTGDPTAPIDVVIPAGFAARHLEIAATIAAGEYVAYDGQPLTTAVAVELAKQRARKLARDALAREDAGIVEIPVPVGLPDLLTEPDDPLTWSVENVLPAGAKFMLAAQHKAGKSTLAGNLVRAWADGTPFLDAFPTTEAGSIVVIDNELGRSRLRRWYRDLAIDKTHAVHLLDLRGQASTFNILDPSTRTRWAEQLSGANAAVIDCLRPFLDALGLDENHDAGRFLEALVELMTEAQIDTYGVVHHMGHAGDHARGDSRILDWPDVIWNLRRATPDDPDDPGDDAAIPRFFSAYGRDDVSVTEGRVDYDPVTHALTFVAGQTRHAARAEATAARRDAKRLELRTALMIVIGGNPGCLAGELDPLLRERGIKFHKGDETKEVTRMVRDGLVRREPGTGRAVHHFLTNPDPPISPGG